MGLLQSKGYLKDLDVLIALGLDGIGLKLPKHITELNVKLLLICGQKIDLKSNLKRSLINEK